jgi:hypothetical protein
MTTLIMLTACFVLLFPSRVNATTGAPAATVQRTVTLWLQATDSCEQALPGASFSLVNASGQTFVAPLTRGTARVTIADARGACPLAHGNCTRRAAGCTAWHIVVPATGSVTYRIVENATRARGNGLTFLENPTGPGGSALDGFAVCTGGSACHSESGTVTVSSSGTMTVIVKNVAPDTTVQTYGPFTGKANDPVLFHNYMVGNNYKSDPCDASKGNVQMNYGTGTESAHCMYVP